MSSPARIGPNPWIKLYARHIPTLGIWGGLMGAFLLWPAAAVLTEKKGIWKV